MRVGTPLVHHPALAQRFLAIFADLLNPTHNLHRLLPATGITEVSIIMPVALVARRCKEHRSLPAGTGRMGLHLGTAAFFQDGLMTFSTIQYGVYTKRTSSLCFSSSG